MQSPHIYNDHTLLVQSPPLLLARTAHVVAGAGRGVGRVGILFPASPHGLVGLLKNIICFKVLPHQRRTPLSSATCSARAPRG